MFVVEESPTRSAVPQVVHHTGTRIQAD